MMRKKPRPPYLFTATLSFCVHLAPARINDHLSALRGGRTPVFSILYVLYTHARRVRIKVSLSTRRFLYFFFLRHSFTPHLVFYFIARRILNYNVLCHSKCFIWLKSVRAAPPCSERNTPRGKFSNRRDARLFSKLSHPSNAFP